MKKRIIAVDDELGMVRLLKVALPEYDVQIETDPTLALTAALKAPPDLLLLDIRMPGLTGTALAGQFAQHPPLRTVPIIFLSALVHSSSEAGEPVMIDGYPAFGKPFRLHRLKQYLSHRFANGWDEGADPLEEGMLAE